MTKTIRLTRPADPFASEIAARLAAKRRRAGMPAKAETPPAVKSGRLTPFIAGLRALADQIERRV